MASCWICLDDEADQYGKSPVRDCSRRGMMLALPIYPALLTMLEGKALTTRMIQENHSSLEHMGALQAALRESTTD
jgi:hypothetical protein